MLELNASCGGPQDALVLGVDIDIRPHNREAIEAHPLYRRIEMIQGSSVAPEVVGQVRARATGRQRILVCLDSNHTHEHALAELKAYAPLVSVGSYCVVFDTVIEHLPGEMYPDRPLGAGQQSHVRRLRVPEGAPRVRIGRTDRQPAPGECCPKGILEAQGLIAGMDTTIFLREAK